MDMVGVYIVFVYVAFHSSQQFLTDCKGNTVKNCQVHIHVMIGKKVFDRGSRYLQCLVLRVSIDSAGDQREGYALAFVLVCQFEGFCVCTSE